MTNEPEAAPCHEAPGMAHHPSVPCNTASRRAFVGSVAAMAASPWLLSACSTTPGSAHTASTESSEAGVQAVASQTQQYRLANRVSWGATDAELERVRRLGSAGYIDEQLRAGANPALPAAAQVQIDAFRISQITLPNLVWDLELQRRNTEAIASEEGRKAAQQAYQQELTRLAREAASRHLLRALYSPQPLREQMTWFWFNHFNVHQHKGNLRAMVGDYEERAIRPHALGRFRDLLGAVSRHPAMLRYLDNERNAANRINENFARELLELHTLGVDGGYGQRDVQELARLLTGHGINHEDTRPNLRRDWMALYVRDGLYEFNPGRHDFGDKNLLGQGVRGRGAAELDDVLDTLAAHPSTARFVCGKLARHFLADEPPPRLVEQMAAAWERSRGHMASVLGVLLRTPEFTAVGPGKFKDPMHFVVSAVRACYSDRTVLNTQPLQNWLNRLGQGLYNRQTPDGYPSASASWSSSGQMATRFEIARALGNNSAGLFKADDATAPREPPAFPQLKRPIYDQVVRGLMAPATRQALDTAASPQDWNALYLSSPEFMYT
jgi:uncharacterized protein (DUF1800 family)